jgi:hypothetical protein
VTEISLSKPPKLEARIGGLLYLIIIAAGFFSEGYVRGNLVVNGNAAATAHNILGSELLFRLGGAAEFVTLSCDIAVALILYVLLRPVNRDLALLAAFFRLVFTAVYATLSLTHFAPIYLLKGGGALAVFTTEQLQAAAMFSFRLHDLGYNVSLVFFGIHCMLIGGLIAASGLLPRVIGGLLAIAGGCYVVNSFASFIVPGFASMLFPYILLPGFVAELCLAVWLLIFGLNEQRWRQVADRVLHA